MPSIPQGAKNKIGFCLSGQGTVDKVERRVILDSLPAMHPYQFSKAAIPHLPSTSPVDVHAQEPLLADMGAPVRATRGQY